MRHLLPTLSLFACLTAQAPPAPAPHGGTDSGSAAHVAAVQAGRDAGLRHVVFDRPEPRGPLWAAGSNWKAAFDATGCTFLPFFGADAPQHYPVRLELAAATVAGAPLVLADGEPARNGTEVRTPRGALTEVMATSLDGLEQSFVFDHLPRRGELTVAVRIATELTAGSIDGGLRFANERGHVDYTKAVAIDAAGRRLPLAIEWRDGAARMVIPASFVETAQLPLVLDPLLNGWFLLASGQTQPQSKMDVASFQALGGRTLVVYRRQWALTDQDCWGILFDGNLGLVATDFPIDLTTDDWLDVAVAANNYAQNFLVVAEIRVGLQHYVGGRTAAATGVLGSLFPIEREGVVGTPGNNHEPDVGGDPYFGPGRYTVVFTKRNLTQSLIYMKQVSPAGSLLTTNAVGLETDTSTLKSKPSIGKSCGPSNGPPAQWLVTWQRQWPFPPHDQDTWGRFVAWNGPLNTNAFPIAITTQDETSPSASSPIDVQGQRFWPLVHERATSPGQPRDIACSILRSDGTVAQTGIVNNNGFASGLDDREPEVDADGIRFVVGYTTLDLSGVNTGPLAATMAYTPHDNTLHIEGYSDLNTLTTASEDQVNVYADSSGGSVRTPRYVVTFRHATTNSFNMWGFLAHRGDLNYFTVRPTQCGSLPITATGMPALGQTVGVAIGGAGFRGTLFGLPGTSSLQAIGCNCTLGVSQPLTMPAPLSWVVPGDPAFVGLPLAVQGFSFSGSACLGQIDLSDTIEFTIR